MTKKYVIFIIYLLSILNSAKAQNRYFEWMNPKTHSRDRIDVDSKTYFREGQAGIWNSIGTFTLDSNVLEDLPQKFSTQFFYTSKLDSILFTVAGTGKVYQFNQAKKLLTRLDKTYSKGYNFNAPQFVRNDTLYNFGGYGFWSYSRVLTYYDQTNQEWQNIRTENFGPESFSEGYQGYAKQNDTFYSGASEIELGLKIFNRVVSDRLYAFDFKSLKWTELGEINSLLPFKSVRIVYWDGAHFIQMLPDKMYIIDPIKNEVSVVANPKYFHLKSFYTVGDSIFSYLENQKTQVRLSKKALLKEAKYIGKFYEDVNYTLYGYLIVGIALLCFGAVVYFRFKKPQQHSTTIVKNGHHFGLLEHMLLKKLIEAEADGQATKFISVLQINEILKLETKTPENQRRIRTKFLNNLNMKLLLYFQVQDAIERFQFEEDKRLTFYRLKDEVKPVLVALL